MSKIDEVAAAVYAEFENRPKFAQRQMNGMLARDLALAAIRALREPDKSMLHAAERAMSPGRRPTPERVSVREKHKIRYRAMIDQLLSEEGEKP